MLIHCIECCISIPTGFSGREPQRLAVGKQGENTLVVKMENPRG